MSEPIFLLLGYALEHALASGVIALIVWVLCRTRALAPGAKAGILFAALMLSVFGPMFPRFDGIGAEVGNASRQAPAMPLQAAGDALVRIEPDTENATSWVPGHLRIGEPAAMLLIAIWCLGAAWRLARYIQGYARLRRIVAASQRSRALEAEYRHLVRPGVEIRLCASFGPAVVGALRPKILVPERLAAALPADAMRAVILHEASHIRRNDIAAHAVQKIVEALFWWNPMVRWMGASLDVSREIACDVAASRSCETPVDYADALLTAIEHVVPSPEVRVASALGMADALRTLDERIDGIIEARGETGTKAKLASLAVLLCMAVACVAAEALSRPLAPMPVAPEPAAIAAPDKRSPSRSPAPVSAGSSDRAPIAQTTKKPKTAEAKAAKSERAAAAERASQPSAESVEEDYRRTALLADQEFQHAASRADEDYQRTASQTDQEYIAATAMADETYQRRFAELEHATPVAAFEARHAQIGRERNQTVSAANRKYKTRMAEANGKYKTRMTSAKGEYETRMAGAKERYDAAMKAGRAG